MEFMDACGNLSDYLPTDEFDLDAWHRYADQVSPDLFEKVENDISGYDFTSEVLPVLRAALKSKEKLETTRVSFHAVSKYLQKNFIAKFGKDLNVDIILYFGLCSGAGWATFLGDKKVVLLGIEKIVELDWCDKNSMFALIAHETGHIWHMDAGGAFYQQSTKREKAVFQLYSEGVAMWFEQELCGNCNYYHQDKNGWLAWCEKSLQEIKREYLRRVENDISIQDFFGDWCHYKGYSDVGYYLGYQFVRFLLNKYGTQRMSRLKNDMLYQEFTLFASQT